VSSNETARRLVDKLWSYCHVLRDDGVSSTDYVEQLTYLLFLKIAEEQRPLGRLGTQMLPDDDAWAQRGWPELLRAKGSDLSAVYQQLLDDLGSSPDDTTFHLIFDAARNKIRSSTHLRRLVVDFIESEKWSVNRTTDGQLIDVKGDAYEQLLARGASDVKSGAGQYFTPRVLVQTIVECVQPTPADTITDPACGTGGFLLAAWDYIRRNHGGELNDVQNERYRSGEAIWGTELVHTTARLAAMNLYLHNIGTADGKPVIQNEDALRNRPIKRATLVLANPPFGKKSSVATYDEDGAAGNREAQTYKNRTDFWDTTSSNKQLNFVQHIVSLLEIGGRAAVVLPDNVLSDAGIGETIRRSLLRECDVHTMLRLPTGLFYANGIKANVLFFTRKPARSESEPPATKRLWVYDFRTGMHFTLKQNPLTREALQDFVDSYQPDAAPDERVETERFKSFSYEELMKRDKANLNITWLSESDDKDGTNLPAPQVLVEEITLDLQLALGELEKITDSLRATLVTGP
jgi:type I restriction enzyme M protein